ARNLAVFAALATAGHPRFQIILAIGWPAEVSGAGVDDLVRQAQPLPNLLLDVQELLMDALALVGCTESKHLDLAELVHAIQAARVTTGSAGLRAEAMRQADILQRKLELVQDLITQHAAEGDLRGGDQAEVCVFQAVDLRLGPPRNETDPFEHVHTG